MKINRFHHPQQPAVNMTIQEVKIRFRGGLKSYLLWNLTLRHPDKRSLQSPLQSPSQTAHLQPSDSFSASQSQGLRDADDVLHEPD